MSLPSWCATGYEATAGAATGREAALKAGAYSAAGRAAATGAAGMAAAEMAEVSNEAALLANSAEVMEVLSFVSRLEAWSKAAEERLVG